MALKSQLNIHFCIVMISELFFKATWILLGTPPTGA